MSIAVTSLLLLLTPAAPAAQGPDPVTLEELAALEDRLVALTDHVQAVTVGLQTGSRNGGGASASGVLVSAEGHILTVAHAYPRTQIGKEVLVIMSDGSEHVGVTKGLDESADFGLIQLKNPGSFPFAEMGTSEDLQTGDLVMCVGHPGGYVEGREPVVRLGTVGPSRRSWLISSAVLMPGDSGGPLFDLDGRVVGINSRIETDEDKNYHVRVERYRDNWDQLVAGEDLTPERNGRRRSQQRRPMFGAVLDNHVRGIRVNEVRELSPALQAGLEVGDIITHIDGERVASRWELGPILREYDRGDGATLKVMRDEQTVELEITFGVWQEEEEPPAEEETPGVPLGGEPEAEADDADGEGGEEEGDEEGGR